MTTDAQTLFRQGVLAVREKNLPEGRKLLMQSLQLDPNNEMGWLWLSRTVAKPEVKLECLDRALKLNPANESAQALRRQILDQMNPQHSASTASANGIEAVANRVVSPKRKRSAPTPNQSLQIKGWLDKAEELVGKNDIEGALDKWIRVLEVVPDHEIALPSAVRHLSRLKHMDDVRELVWNALESGTELPSVYLTAIDVARYEQNEYEANELRERLALLPTATEDMIGDLVDYYRGQDQDHQAEAILTRGIESHPTSQKLLLRMGDLLSSWERKSEAQRYYERAARLGAGTKAGKEADQRLLSVAPLMTDKERGSMVLAWREALGIGVAFWLMGWQDAGLDMALMGPRWVGVILSVAGGYLLVTATSSPQQRPLGRLLGGELPEKPKRRKHDEEPAETSGAILDMSELPIIPAGARVVIGGVGVVILIVAFWLVFNQAIALLQNPAPTCIPTIEQLINDEVPGC
ncbi:MAG: hypothetical protein K8I60_09135 [Anaerolineae bacterium]|nr:hypothetical protein [Anaerolineae bacterium]